MALGRQVQHAVDAVFGEESLHGGEVGDIGTHEGVVEPALQIAQVGSVARIGQRVEVHNTVVGVFIREKPHHVGAYEPRPAGNKNIFHSGFMFNSVLSIVLRVYSRSVR